MSRITKASIQECVGRCPHRNRGSETRVQSETIRGTPRFHYVLCIQPTKHGTPLFETCACAGDITFNQASAEVRAGHVADARRKSRLHQQCTKA